MLGRRIFLLTVAAGLLLPWGTAARASHQAASSGGEDPSGARIEIWRSYSDANEVSALAPEGDLVWAGTEGGVVRWDRTAGTYIKYTVLGGLANNSVPAVAVDAAGRKRFGTYSGGVSEFDGTTWTTYTQSHGLAHDIVYAIAVDGAGHMWFGTHGGVSRFDGSTWTTYTTADSLAHNDVYAIAVDGAGDVWFGCCWRRIDVGCERLWGLRRRGWTGC